jgi:hypothetical protein
MSTYRRKPKRQPVQRDVTAEEQEKAQRPAEPRRPALARTRTDRLKRQMLGMDRAGHPCACDDKTPCLAHAGITGRRRWVRPK